MSYRLHLSKINCNCLYIFNQKGVWRNTLIASASLMKKKLSVLLISGLIALSSSVSAFAATDVQPDNRYIYGISLDKIEGYVPAADKFQSKVFTYTYNDGVFRESEQTMTEWIAPYLIDDKTVIKYYPNEYISWKVKSQYTLSKNSSQMSNYSTIYEIFNRATGETLISLTPTGNERMKDVFINIVGHNYHVLDLKNSSLDDHRFKGFNKEQKSKIIAALFALHKYCPDYYDMVMQTKHFKYSKKSDAQAFIYKHNLNTIYITDIGLNSGVIDIAAFLVHEAQHITDYKNIKKAPEYSAFTASYTVKKALGKSVNAQFIEREAPMENYTHHDWYIG